MRKSATILSLVVVLGLARAACAAIMSPGDLAILRVGNGEALANTGNGFFIDEYTTGGSFVQAVTVSSTGATGLQLSGTATSEGALSLSGDGTSLVFGGYNPGASGFGGTGSLANRTAAQAPRAYGSVDASSTYTFGGTFGSNYSANNIRGATGSGGSFWGAGGNTGTVKEPSDVVIQSSNTNTRVINVQNGNLYYSTGSGSSRGIFGFNGLPTSATSPSSVLITGTNTDNYDFAFSPGPLQAGSYAYIADATAGVQRWDFDGSTWGLSRTFTITGNGATGLAVDFTTNTVYAVTPAALWKTVDSGSGGAMSSIATAPSATAFRGLEFTPVPEPSTIVLAVVGAAVAVGVGRRRLRKREQLSGDQDAH